MVDSLRLEGVPPSTYVEFTQVGRRCLVRLVLEGLDATTQFWQDTSDPLGSESYHGGGLAEFLSDLAENWQGWEGVKSWGVWEGAVEIHAEHDGLGHITLTFKMREPDPPYGWEVTGPLSLEAGALDRLATMARRYDARES